MTPSQKFRWFLFYFALAIIWLWIFFGCSQPPVKPDCGKVEELQQQIHKLESDYIEKHEAYVQMKAAFYLFCTSDLNAAGFDPTEAMARIIKIGATNYLNREFYAAQFDDAVNKFKPAYKERQ